MMATCKDCLHYDVCEALKQGHGIPKVRPIHCRCFKPASNFAEVNRGEWIFHECVSSHDGTISGYSCSQCCIFVDEEMFDADEFHKDFCGHCGADMRPLDKH